jgi:hypothetical protein
VTTALLAGALLAGVLFAAVFLAAGFAGGFLAVPDVREAMMLRLPAEAVRDTLPFDTSVRVATRENLD